MKFPKLVPKSLAKTEIQVKLFQEGLSETGGPLVALDASFRCNYQDKASTVLTDEQKLVKAGAAALIDGDICPGLAVISSGEVVIFGETRNIVAGSKARNPDGTVNYTRLELE